MKACLIGGDYGASTKGVGVTRTFIHIMTFVVAVMISPNRTVADTAPAPEIPKDFDPSNLYKTYTYNKLYEHIEESFRKDNLFVGEKVKIVASYQKLTDFAQIQNGCYSESPLCKYMIPVKDPTSTVVFGFGEPFLYINNKRGLGDEMRDLINDRCDYYRHCYFVVSGTLRIYDVELSFATKYLNFTPSKIVYLDVDNS